MPTGEMQVTYGNVSNTFLLKATLTPVAVGATTAAQQTFTVNGLQLGDQISDVSLQAAWTVGVSLTNAWVSAANTLAVSYYNGTAGSLTPPSGSYYIEVNRPDLQNLPSSWQ
jgi:hypothetical protein